MSVCVVACLVLEDKAVEDEYMGISEELATSLTPAPAVVQCNTPFREKGALLEYKLSGLRSTGPPVLLRIFLKRVFYMVQPHSLTKKTQSGISVRSLDFHYVEKTQHKCRFQIPSAAFKVFRGSTENTRSI